ncbi:membrane dipeptidase [Phytohabitans sp. ZYX-F-186]|uniref:Membrane dipeptidase n=1 Tax=Phytohabitans maris TaxID=3071409 RepID=A0ABU0ZNX9_9ACTN|nr:membrane dipeptidase [Phytohabitans sp. ZYX-F-186]MDQ7908748.1 membrane dipeptidase [Phytohabitans sp. ZYX-F-186]
MSAISFFDGHNDILSLTASRPNGWQMFGTSDSSFPINLRDGLSFGYAGGFFASYQRSEPGVALDQAPARQGAIAMMSDLIRIEAHSNGALEIVRSTDDLRRCVQTGTIAAIQHLEGAEAVDPDLHTLDLFYELGLRSIGPLWSRPNAFGYGVQTEPPNSVKAGRLGLTASGLNLVRACNRLGIMIDVSHMNEDGFWDVARTSDSPVVATHSNAQAIAPVARNLTDSQLDAIRDSDGLVGVSFYAGMLRPDGRADPNTPLDIAVKHIEHIAERLGLRHVGLGTDFGTATCSSEIHEVSQVPTLFETLRARGWSEPDLSALGIDNWIRILDLTWRK